MVEQPTTRRTPSWAVVCLAAGAVIMVLAGGVLVAVQWAFARYEGAVQQRDLFGELNQGEAYGEDIEGPLNILLVGLDTRPSRPEEPPRSDAIMIVHIEDTLDRGHLISIPRDTLVQIPAYEATGWYGGRDRINAAMFHGSQQIDGEQLPDIARGFELLAMTVGELTGIERFDAGVVIDFEGFTDVIDAMGGITMTIEERIVSEHRKPDGSHRPLNAYQTGYVGEQMVYEPGEWELEGWQALDIARQRYGVEGSDFGRQRNQQLLLRAILDRALSRDVVTDPVALDRVLRAAGESLTFDGRGHRVIDYAFALRDVRPNSMEMIGLPATNVGLGSGYQGEELDPAAYDFFAALAEDRIDAFLLENPEFHK